MNKYKVSYIITALLDFILTFGGTAGVIVYNYIDENNSNSFKITLTGIVLLIAMLFTCKTIFEKNFQNKENSLLQALAMATDQSVKDEINRKIDIHKTESNIYQRLMILLPFAILFIVTYLGSVALEEMHGTVGMILASLGGGSVFNVIKKQLKDKADVIKFQEKAKKRNK